MKELIDRYLRAADTYGKATVEGNHKAANAAHETLSFIWEQLRALGPEAIRDLLPLLVDPHEWVRCWAAAHLLQFSPADAEPVLETLAAAKGLAAMDARIILANWRRS